MPFPAIHPTAIIDPEADLAPNVEVGPFAVIEGKVRLGPGCIVRARAHLIGELIAGRDNDFGIGCIIGERPQHTQYRGEDTRTVIGDGNIFREHVTIHRGTTASGMTVIGNHNMFLVGSHVAHDCRIGNHVLMANSAVIAGHVEVGDRAFLSGNSAVHQFCRVGRFALLSGCSATSKDLTPFVMVQRINTNVGVNVVGMRRAGVPPHEIQAVRQAYQILFRQDKLLRTALFELEAKLGHSELVREMVEFVRTARRGISLRHHADPAAESEAA